MPGNEVGGASTRRFPVSTALWLFVALVLSAWLTASHSPLRPLPGVITMLLIPGAWVMNVLHCRPSSTSGRLALAVSLSMMVIMVVGFVASVVGPHLGVARPLDSQPEVFIWLSLGALLLVHATKANLDPVASLLEDLRPPHLYVFLASGMLGVISILGVAQLNHSANDHLAIFSTCLDVAVLIAGIVGGWNRWSRWPLSTLLYSASLALMLSISLRGGHLYGWDIQKEFGVASETIRAGRWVPPANRDAYPSMLSLTVLPAILSSLVKLRLLAFFQLLIPAILALLPVAVFNSIRSVPRYITAARLAPRPGLAFAVVAALIVSSEAFSSELVSITRQAMALTILTVLVMVLFDRTMAIRQSRIIIGLLIVEISFTHYTTSYLLAGIMCVAWTVSLLWSRVSMGRLSVRQPKFRNVLSPQRGLSAALVVLAVVAAFGWNYGVTRNDALNGATSALISKGAGFVATATGTTSISAMQLERILVSELRRSASYLHPVPGSASVPLVPVTTPGGQTSTSILLRMWNASNFLLQESLWLLAGGAMLLAVTYLVRRRANFLSPDIVGFTVAVLLMGAFLRFSGTLASFYSPSRAAIFVAIFVAAPVTMFLDDLVTLLSDRWKKVSLAVGAIAVGVMSVWATGLGAVIFGETPPGSLTAQGENVQDFTVSSSELATATWIRDNVPANGIVQADEFGQLVLTSVPAKYDLIDEIVPPGVGRGAYIYLSKANLVNNVSSFNASGGTLSSSYRSTVSFFNENFNVVYSTGETRVYH